VEQSIKTNFDKNSLPHSYSIDNLCGTKTAPLGKNPKFNPKAVDQKLDDVSGKLATILCINKVHFAKMTDLMEQMAYNNRLTPGALHHEVLLEIVRYINKITNNSEMLSFVHEPSEIFLVETSYIYRLDENTFVLVLHIPLVSPQNLMPLYEFISLPIHINFTGNVSVTPEVRITNTIAVGHSKSYQVISSTDPHSCIQMGETYFCKGRNVLLTDFTKTCL
jgi:hypothetical protein